MRIRTKSASAFANEYLAPPRTLNDGIYEWQFKACGFGAVTNAFEGKYT